MFNSTRARCLIAGGILASVATISAFGSPLSAETLRTKGPIPSDPLLQWVAETAPRNTFYLWNKDDVELVRFKKQHDIEICAARPDPDEIGSARHGYPLKVTWDQEVGIIMPGNCLNFDAQSVKVSAATDIPQSVQLTGTVRVIH